MFHANRNDKKAGISILISDKIDWSLMGTLLVFNFFRKRNTN